MQKDLFPSQVHTGLPRCRAHLPSPASVLGFAVSSPCSYPAVTSQQRPRSYPVPGISSPLLASADVQVSVSVAKEVL